MDNRIKTFLLLLVLTAIIIFIGSLFGTTGLIVAIVIVFVMNFVSYWWSDRIVLGIYRAKPASKKDYLWLHKTVEEIAKEAKMPKPKIYVVPLKISNAFATGRNPENASIAVTEGILKTLSKDELKGVLAHEISHVKNRDILVMTIAATLAGAIMFIANMMRFAAIFGAEESDSGNIIGLLLVTILAPIAALLVQMAISRSREYMADETGAKLIKNGEPLAQALIKLHHGPKLRDGVETTAHLFIVNPLNVQGIASLFSTHPPVEKRIERLRQMKF